MPGYKYLFDGKAGIDIVENSGNKSGISVARLGGEIISFRAYNEKEKQLVPLLYRDGIIDPTLAGWKNHATVLFPIVGGLINKTSIYKGSIKISSKGNHGFARHSLFTLKEKKIGDNSATLGYNISPSSEITGYYPFDFSFDVTYTISKNDLSVEFAVENKEKNRALPFSIGWHPGFSAPMFSGKGKKADCKILMEKGDYTHVECDKNSKLTGRKKAVHVDEYFPWTEDGLDSTTMLFINDKNKRRVSFFDPNSKVKVAFNFPDFPYLGFWANKGENYICIEPWHGLDDHVNQEPFENKLGLIELAPGKKDTRKISVSVEFE